MSSTVRVCASRLASGLLGEQPKFYLRQNLRFQRSQDGKQLLVSQGEISCDVVLVSNLP